MLQRLYAHNFRCLENFTLDLRNMPTALLIGKNGAGNSTDPLRTFKSWLARMILLNPLPPKMNGESRGDTLEPELDGSNIGDWLTGLLG